jgi:hypothetical protein
MKRVKRSWGSYKGEHHISLMKRGKNPKTQGGKKCTKRGNLVTIHQANASQIW